MPWNMHQAQWRFCAGQDHDELAARVEATQIRAQEMAALVRQFIWVAPHAGQWDAARSAFQSRRSKLLKSWPAAQDDG